MTRIKGWKTDEKIFDLGEIWLTRFKINWSQLYLWTKITTNTASKIFMFFALDTAASVCPIYKDDQRKNRAKENSGQKETNSGLTMFKMYCCWQTVGNSALQNSASANQIDLKLLEQQFISITLLWTYNSVAPAIVIATNEFASDCLLCFVRSWKNASF